MTKWTITQGGSEVHSCTSDECKYNFPKNTGDTNLEYTVMVVDDNGCQVSKPFVIPSGEECKTCEPNISLYIACVDCAQYVYIKNEKACPGTIDITLESSTSLGNKYLTDIISFDTSTIHTEQYKISNEKNRQDAYKGLVTFTVGGKEVKVTAAYCGCVISVAIGGYYQYLYSMTIDNNKVESNKSTSLKFDFGDVEKSYYWRDVSFDIRDGYIPVDTHGSISIVPSNLFATCCQNAAVDVCKYAKIISVDTVTAAGFTTIYVEVENENYGDEVANEHSINVDLKFCFAEDRGAAPGTWDTYTCDTFELSLKPGRQEIKGVRVDKHTGTGNGNKPTLVRVEMTSVESTYDYIHYVSGEYYYVDLYYYNISTY